MVSFRSSVLKTTTTSQTSGSTSFHLHLDSTGNAYFATSILFGFVTLLQIVRCVFALRHPGNRGAFITLLFSLLFFFIYYVMTAIETVKDLNLVEDPNTGELEPQEFVQQLLPLSFYGIWGWTWAQATILLSISLLVHLRNRGVTNAKASQNLSPPAFGIWKWIINAVIVFFWQLLTFAHLGLYEVDLTTENFSLQRDLAPHLTNMAYAKLAFWGFLTMDIWISAGVMRAHILREKFVDNNITFIALITGPAIAIAVLSNIAYDIVYRQTTVDDLNVDALGVADTVIEGLAILIGVSAFLEGSRLSGKPVSQY